MNRVHRWMSVAGAVLAVASAALAQTNHAAWSKIETGGWALTPIYAQPSSGPSAVVSFLALAKPGTTTGANIVAVWYKKDGTTWSTKSWETTDPWVAINSVKQDMGIPSSQDERWGVPPPIVGSTPTEPPVDYASGVLADDDLAAFVETFPDRREIVEILAAIGDKAADLPFEKDESCTLDVKLDALASRATSMVNDGDVTIATLPEDSTTCRVLAMPFGPKPIRPAKPATAPAWTPPGTVPTAPAWIPGGFPVAPATRWSCTSSNGGSSCFCSRGQYWGRWELRTCPWRPWAMCVDWHEIWEEQTCTTQTDNPPIACPAGGPPSDEQNCNSTFR